jgi:hypothetical protein
MLLPQTASKNVRGAAPVPPQAAGSSALPSVDATLTRKMLISSHTSSTAR